MTVRVFPGKLRLQNVTSGSVLVGHCAAQLAASFMKSSDCQSGGLFLGSLA
jgi:hypothetical protein